VLLHKTLLDEWAYGRLYRSNAECCHAFGRWLRFYNRRRPHTSLDGLTPMAVLVNTLVGTTPRPPWFDGMAAGMLFLPPGLSSIG
jgi:integrase-like protein